MKRSHLAFAMVMAGAPLAIHAEPGVPDGYAGPIATVFDSALRPRGGGAQFFFVSSVDGRTLDTNLDATRRVNQGKGNSMVLMTQARELPAQPLKLVLEGQTAFAAPIVEIFKASQMLSVKRTVSFTPQMNRTYVVRGSLKPEETAVWIEDAETHERVPATEIAEGPK